MGDVQFDGSAQPQQLTDQIQLTAPGLAGYATFHVPESVQTRGPALGTADLESALKSTALTELGTIELTAQDLGSLPPAGDVRGPNDVAALELAVSDVGPEWGAVVLVQDEAGRLSWHFPLDESNQLQPPTRGGTTKVFRIPRAVAQKPEDEAAETRGLLGMLGSKLLKILVYPVTDPIIGAVGEAFARAWEENCRKARIRRVSPETYQSEDAALMSDADWAELQEGRALLFLHGTFSRTQAAFGGFPEAVMADLMKLYENRLFAFDHYTISEGLVENANRFLRLLPAGANLEVDIISHSRGGLLARTLAEQFSSLQHGGRQVKVGRVILAGVPNQGTALADPEHMGQMLDRYTTLLNLYPVPHVTVILEGIITVVKTIGCGLLKGLDGLACMNPKGISLNGPAAPAGLEYYGIAANFDPEKRFLASAAASVMGGTAPAAAHPGLGDVGKDVVMDDIFKEPNDLVVPTAGVFAANGNPNFPIPPAHLLLFGPENGVTHSHLFEQPLTGETLLTWLKR